ncbi:hypothetical protein UO96_03725, partial [Enterobacter hormaechei]
GTADIYKKK